MEQDKSSNNKYSSKYTSSNDNYISKIKNMFDKMIEKNKINNKIKSSLKNIQNFDSKIIFQEIDLDGKGYINYLDLINYLKKFTNNYNEQIIRRLIQQYDKHSHFKLIYDDFKSMIFPNNKAENEESNKDQILDIDKNEIFNKIINNEFQLIIMINEMLIDIKKCDNFITYEAFISISHNEKNIDQKNMEEFIGNKYDINDIHFLIYYLDMNNDGLIAYDDFEDFFVTLDINQKEINNFKNIDKFEYKKNNNVVFKNTLNQYDENELFNEKINNKYIKNIDNDNFQDIKNENDINIKERKYQCKYCGLEKNKKNYINEINYESKTVHNNNQTEYNQLENNQKEYYKYIHTEITDNNENNLNDNEVNNMINFNDNIKSNEKDLYYNKYNLNINTLNNINNQRNSYSNKNNSKEKIINDNNLIYIEEEKENKYIPDNNKQEYKINKPFSIKKNNLINENNVNKYLENENKEINNYKKNDNRNYYYNSSYNYNNNMNEKYIYERLNKKTNDSQNENIDNSQNEINDNNIKEKSGNDDYNYSNSNNEFDNYHNNRDENEYDNNQNYTNSYNNNNNEYNNFYSSNNFSGNLRSTDFNKSDNFIYENNNISQKNEIEESNNKINVKELNNNNKKNINYNNDNKVFNNNYNIQRDNIQYIQNNNKINKITNNIIKPEELLIQKNTNIEIKKDINYINKQKEKEKEKSKLKQLLELNKIKYDEKDFNNIKVVNINDNTNNNINNSNNSNNSNNTNRSINSHSHPININGSLFTVGGNISVKTNKNDSDVEEYKNNLNNNVNNNNNAIYQKRTENSSLQINPNLYEKTESDYDEENNINNNNNYENNYNDKYILKNKYINVEDKINNEGKEKEKVKEKINYKRKNDKISKINEEAIFDTKINNAKIEYQQEKKIGKNKDYNNNNKNNMTKISSDNKQNNDLVDKETEDFTNFLQDKYKAGNKNEINNKKINIEQKNLFIKNNNNIKEKVYDKISSSSKKEFNYINDQALLNSGENNNNINDFIYSKEYSSNSFNSHSLNLFLDYIENILQNENICYTLKESLSLREDMTFKELFCLFDYHQNKNISIHEFQKVCKNIFGLYPTYDQIRLIFNRYDINKDEKLDLKEFLNMISPIKKEYLGILFGDKKVQKPFHSELSDKSKKIIVNLMKTIILNETNYYELREKMKSDNYTVNDVWSILIEFSKNKNCLNLKEFGEFLKNYSFNLTSYEVEIIFNKIDFDKDELINYDDFNHEFIL